MKVAILNLIIGVTIIYFSVLRCFIQTDDLKIRPVAIYWCGFIGSEKRLECEPHHSERLQIGLRGEPVYLEYFCYDKDTKEYI